MTAKKGRRKRAPTRGERVIRWIEGHCVVPEGKLVGQPIKLRPWQRREIKRIYDNPAGTRRAILSFGRKNRKGLAIDTPIPTPSGWRTMADIQPGDYVFGSDGLPTRVIGVSGINTGLRCWRLRFSDGTEIVADEEHRWFTRHSYRPWEPRSGRSKSGNGGRWREGIVTTPQIAESVHRPRSDGGREHNHKLPVAPALETPDVPLPIDPYVLGAWLGDGTSASGAFTCSYDDLDDMRAHLSAGLGGRVVVRHNSSGRAPTICTPGLGFRAALRELGVLGNKHIPEQYLMAGTAQRWSLLQGLMDTDGTVNRNGGRYPRASFTGTNKRLCRGVWRLARSLGLKATFRESEAKLNGRVVGPKYEVAFAADRSTQVFRLRRKQVLLPESIASRSRTLAVVSCEPVQSVPTKCIAVDAQDKLYLAGEGCVATHNTALSACLLLAHLVGPEARPNGQLYSAAQSRDQAAILFGLAAKMVRMNPGLSEFVGIRDSAKQLYCPELGTSYRALSADASTAYGLSPVFVVHDELGQVRGPRSELYEALETATGAQEDPLSIIISTQAPTDNDLLSLLIDDALTGADPRVVVSHYTAPEDVDAFSDKAIKAANPAFGDFQNADEVRAMAADAKRLPTREAEYRNLILNQRVDRETPYIARAVWEACKGRPAPLDGLPVYAGLDLSSVGDLTALVLVGVDDAGVHHVHPTFWLPGDGLAERARQDRVPYDVWAAEGHLTPTPGRAVDYAWVAERLAEVLRRYDVRAIGFDRWNWQHLRPWIERAGVGPEMIDGDDAVFRPLGQGYQTMSPALRQLEGLLLNGHLRHGGHPVLTMCAANAVVQTDPAGNRKLTKARAKGRIDGMVALAMAVACAADSDGDRNAAPVSPWEDPAYSLEL